MRPATLMLSGESTGTALPSSVRHSGILVETRAETSASSPSTAHSASIAWPPVIVSTLAPLARTPCQMRPGPRTSTAGATHVRLAVTEHSHADDEQVDVRMRRHVAEPMERELRTKRRGRGLGRVLVRGADRLQLVAWQRFERGNVSIGAPAAAALCDRRPNDSHPNLVRHLSLAFSWGGQSTGVARRLTPRRRKRNIPAHAHDDRQ